MTDNDRSDKERAGETSPPEADTDGSSKSPATSPGAVEETDDDAPFPGGEGSFVELVRRARARPPARESPSEPRTAPIPLWRGDAPAQDGGAGATGAARSRPLPPAARAKRFRVGVVLVVALIGAIGVAATFVDRAPVTAAGPSPAVPGPSPNPTAASDPTGPPTLYGVVVEVLDPGLVVVEVQAQQLPIRVLGVDTSQTPGCAADDSLDFARETLLDQRVTLVPDPTLPPSADRAAYVVLASQLSYTDAAIQAGWASAGVGLYRPVFLDEQRAAQDAERGMWGPPCNRPVP